MISYLPREVARGAYFHRSDNFFAMMYFQSVITAGFGGVTGQNPPGHVPPGHLPQGHIPPGHLPPGHLPPGHLPPRTHTPPVTYPLDTYPLDTYPLGHIPPRTYTPQTLRCPIWFMHHVLITYCTLKSIYFAEITVICDVGAIQIFALSGRVNPHNYSGFFLKSILLACYDKF